MSTMTVETASKIYPIYTTEDFGGLAGALSAAGLAGRRVVFVTDDNVAELYLREAEAAAKAVCSLAPAFVFAAGEAGKHLGVVSQMYGHFLKERLDRGSAVIALGGGVAGDMAGFAAATYMRGVAYVQVPTTLLAQVDSSVGGKTAVDFEGAKNAVGAFYQPEFVYTNISALKTLPKEQFDSGLGEVLKHGLLAGGSYLAMLEKRVDDILAMDGSALAAVVEGSCRVKAAVVSADEREGGIRETLNLGHTFGHAIETDSGFALPHGVCVAIGCAAALTLSRRINGMTEADENRARALFAAYGLQTTYNAPGAAERLVGLMYGDKKTKDGRLTAIVLRKIGRGESLKGVPAEDMLDAVKTVLE